MKSSNNIWIHFIRKAKPTSRCYFPYYTKESFLEESKNYGFNRGVNFLASKYMKYGDIILFSEYFNDYSEIFAIGQITTLSINTVDPGKLLEKLNNQIKNINEVNKQIVRLSGKLNRIYEAENTKEFDETVKFLENTKKELRLKLFTEGIIIQELQEPLIIYKLSFTHSYKMIRDQSIKQIIDLDYNNNSNTKKITINMNFEKHPHYIIKKIREDEQCQDKDILQSILDATR